MVRYVRYGLVCLVVLLGITGCKQDEDTPGQVAEAEQATAVEQVTAAELITAAEPVSVTAAEVKPMQLTIRFETSTTNGRYSPANVHAVWIETAAGEFVRTLDLWGNKHAKELTGFKAAVGDLTAAVQARTGATEKVYGTYTSRWDMTDAAGNAVPDGEYVIRFELTSDNAKRDNRHGLMLPFTKNSTPAKIEPADAGGYQNIVLDYAVAADAK